MSQLFIVATPIGNLADITLRALEILKSVDLIICEDTRRTKILLNHYQISKPLTSLHKFTEASRVKSIIEKLKTGKNLALVSDAGTPLIADPGIRLIKACIQEKIRLTVIPGPSALTTAAVISGLPTDMILFLGYLPKQDGKRKKLLEKVKRVTNTINATVIIYEAPHRLLRTLTTISQVFGDIDIVIAKELTKIHEEVKRDKLSTLLDEFSNQKPKGEFTIAFNLQK